MQRRRFQPSEMMNLFLYVIGWEALIDCGERYAVQSNLFSRYSVYVFTPRAFIFQSPDFTLYIFVDCAYKEHLDNGKTSL